MHAGSSSDVAAASVTATTGAPSAWLASLARLRAAACPAAVADRTDALDAALAPVPTWLRPAGAAGGAANDTRPDRLDVMARRRETRHFRIDSLTVLLAEGAPLPAALDLASCVEPGGRDGFGPAPR